MFEFKVTQFVIYVYHNQTDFKNQTANVENIIPFSIEMQAHPFLITYKYVWWTINYSLNYIFLKRDFLKYNFGYYHIKILIINKKGLNVYWMNAVDKNNNLNVLKLVCYLWKTTKTCVKKKMHKLYNMLILSEWNQVKSLIKTYF